MHFSKYFISVLKLEATQILVFDPVFVICTDIWVKNITLHFEVVF